MNALSIALEGLRSSIVAVTLATVGFVSSAVDHDATTKIILVAAQDQRAVIEEAADTRKVSATMANVREVVQVAGFSIYQGDNADDFALTLTTNGAAQDLTGATITMYLRPPANTTPVAFVLTIVSAVAGTCKKTWTAVETNALEVGAHSAVVRVAFGDGTIATWPTHGSLSVQVLRSGDLV